ncbi:MAG: PTS sugar transporter subunit IIA [Eubacteriales bacterium]|nr:PTS sugar transporter subunit IIA [Eubacteriales bacterium]
MNSIFPELIAVDVEADSAEEAIRKVGQIFFDNGYVKDTYIDAVVAREKKYPTGLQLEGMAVAMPHTDPPHVYKSGVCVAKLKHPVTFMHMGTDDQPVEAEMLFMMAITNPNEHMDTLAKVLQVYQNPEVADKFRGAVTTDELYKIAKFYIGEE